MTSALVLNAGSGTVKAEVFGADRRRSAKLTHHRAPATIRVDGGDDAPVDARHRRGQLDALLDAVLADASEHDIDAVAHRIVHGGALQRHSVIDDEVRAAIEAATSFAPLHNGPALELLELATGRLPDATPVACIDTAFHVTIPDAAAAYGGPRRWWERGLRRYGFHGISHHDASRRTAAVLGRPLEHLALVTVHCGGGVSAAAVDGGRSVDTTMGLTPGEGPVMATRAGSVDPGLLIHLMREEGLDADALEEQLMREGGLLGLSGSSGDEAGLRARRAEDPDAEFAIDTYVHRLRSSVGSMIPALGRLDALVLTGDVLESDPELRHDLCAGFGFAGVALDEERNRSWDGDDAALSGDGGTAVVALAADEESAMAGIVRNVLADA